MADRHFVDGELVSEAAQVVVDKLKANRRFLTDEEYGVDLDNIVVSCVDVALIYSLNGRQHVLMGYRTNEPYKGGWALPGGRMFVGESFGDTAQRHVKKNTGLVLDPERFKFVRADSWVWSRREQPPADHGCHMLGVTVFTLLNNQEYSPAFSPRDDLSELKWMKCTDAGLDKMIHPAHRNAVNDILNGRFDR